MKRLLPVFCIAIVAAAVLLTRPDHGSQELQRRHANVDSPFAGTTGLTAAEEGCAAQASAAEGLLVPGSPVRQSVPATGPSPSLPVLIHGRVLAPDGEPAVGARVFARTGGWYSIVPIELDIRDGPRPAGQETLTDGDGRFAMHAGLDPGDDLALSVLFPGSPTERRLRLAFPFAPLDVGTIQLRPGLSVEGRLLDVAGRPLAGAKVLLGVRRGVAGSEGSFPGQGDPVGTSDAQGLFRVANLAPGPWQLLFESPKLCVAEAKGVLAPGDRVDLGDIVLVTGHSIAGRLSGVPDERRGSLRVEARHETLESSSLRRGRRTSLAADGSFRIDGVHPARRVRVRVLEQDSKGAWFPVAEVPQPIVPSDTPDLALKWGETLALTAQIVDPEGAPVEHFQAFADLGYFGGTHEIGMGASDNAAAHHPDGRLEARGMRLYSEESTPELLIHATGFEDFSRPVSGLLPGQQVDLGTLTLTPAARLVLVVRRPDGDPVEGAKLILSAKGSRRQEAASDAAGLATLNANAGSSQLLTIRHPDWATEYRTLPPSQGSSAQVEVTLRPGCQLTVRVADPKGTPLPEHPVELTRLVSGAEPGAAPEPSLRHTGSTGKVQWTDLAPGTYRARSVAAPRTTHEAEAPAQEGEVIQLLPAAPQTLQLTAAPEFEVIGLVRDRNGPLSIATLRLGPTGEGERWGTRYNRVATSFGEFHFARIPHGDYTLEIEHDSRAMLATVPFVVPPPTQPVVIELPLASVRLRVLGPTGRAQPAATIELSTGLPGEGNPNRAWNDARRAWTDERGDLQQAWHQDAIHLRSTGPNGWVQFDGCLPGTEFHLHLEDPWLVATGPTAPLMLAEGEDLRLAEPLIAFPAGALEIHPIGESDEAWRVRWNGSEHLPPELRFRDAELEGRPVRLDHCPSGPSELALEQRTTGGNWELVATLLLDPPQGSVLAVEADLETPALRFR